MLNNINNFLEFIRSDKKIQSYDEITTKQAIILRLLSITGWNIFSVDEVTPEYSVESRRVDYALRIANKNAVFIEVKKPKEDLEDHQEQLLDYAFRMGVEIAILTNGITWWFYIPTKPGSWNSRKFYSIDILEQDTDSISLKFIDLVSKHSIITGEAYKTAEAIHKSKVKKNTIMETLPEAWNKIISEPDSLLLEMVSEITEKICGFKPEVIEVKEFILKNQDRLLLDTEEDLQAHKLIRREIKKSKYGTSEIQQTHDKEYAGRGSGRLAVTLDKVLFEAASIPKLYYKVLQYVVDNGSINKLSIPWGVGSKRYLIYKGNNPMHPNGRDFFCPVKYKDYYMESHVNRLSGVKYLGAFCEMLGYAYKVEEV